MRLPIDIAARVSPELSAIIDRLVSDPDIEAPVTLGLVRESLARGMEATRKRRSDVQETVLAELDALIERCTGEAPAADFVGAKASEPLSRVIETMMNDANTPQRPTLGAVRDALARGIAARLVGEGTIDADEEQGLAAELDGFIGRFGEDALAEHLMRYE
jgi:hypothetical protein